ncbi:hypothetical protein ACTHPH_05375 [Paenibacillus pasadenensis]|uniref:hypothetical protein n=1 Tax=Paenibacillus TaxID=44249 RepID=UPI0003FE9947|nr:hypothetical protein [Paenibacillus pasadenensis]
MSHLAILDFSFADGDSRRKDLAFLADLLPMDVAFESDTYTSLTDAKGLSIGFMDASKLEEAAVREGYRKSVVPNFSLKADRFDSTLEQAVRGGGRVLMPKTDIPDTGWFAIVQTPAGHHLALVEDKS